MMNVYKPVTNHAPKKKQLHLLHLHLLCGILLLTATQTNAQSIGDYRSTVAVFNWTATGNWERWNGTNWVSSSDYPGQNPGTGTVTIRNGATVTINVSPTNPIGGLVVGEGTSGVLQFDNTNNRVLTVGAGGVTIASGGQFNASGTTQDGGNDTYTLTIQGGGAFTNNGTINFRRPDNTNFDVVNLNLSGNHDQQHSRRYLQQHWRSSE